MRTTPPHERSSGRRAPGPKAWRSAVCTGPENSKSPRKAKPITKAGVGGGRSSAHSKTSRPGKRWWTTSHARPVPTTRVPPATPASSANVLTTSSTSWGPHRCRQMSIRGESSEERTTSTGAASAAATATAATVQPERRDGAAGRPPAGGSAAGRRAGALLVPSAVGELGRGGLELAGGGHVDVVLLELPPPGEDGVHRRLRV